MEQVKITLKVEITYDLNGTPVFSLLNLLHGNAQRMADEGLMTGYTEAEVDSWTHSVTLEERE